MSILFHLNLNYFYLIVFENFPFPGAPYLIAAMISMWAFLHSYEISEEPTTLAFIIAKSKTPSDVSETVALLCSELVDNTYEEKL